MITDQIGRHQEPITRSLHANCTLESTLSRIFLFLELRYVSLSPTSSAKSAKITKDLLVIHALRPRFLWHLEIFLYRKQVPKQGLTESMTRRNLVRRYTIYRLPDKDYFTYFDWTHLNFATIKFSTLWRLFCTYARWHRVHVPCLKHRSIEINVLFTIKIRLILKLSLRWRQNEFTNLQHSSL